MNELIVILQKHFPNVSDTTKDRLAGHPTFQEISENYHDCVNALRHWRQSKAPEAEARFSEYQKIAGELEQEALDTFEVLISKSSV